MNYYGTAVPQPPGHNSAPTQPVWAPALKDEVDWCETGCPKRDCRQCQLLDRLRQEYEDLMKQGRIEAAHEVLRQRDSILLHSS